MSILKKLFGNQSERAVRPLWNRLNKEIKPIYNELQSLSHDELRGRIETVKGRIRGNAQSYKDHIDELRAKIETLDYEKREPLCQLRQGSGRGVARGIRRGQGDGTPFRRERDH